MYTFKNMLAVTNRRLCKQPFLTQIDWLASCHPKGIILREKDLTGEEYQALAEQVLDICQRYKTTCILHTQTEAAKRLGCPNIHLPMWKLRMEAGMSGDGDFRQKTGRDLHADFEKIGASVHSVREAEEAVRLGADYLTAGHIFLTDCKKGVPARGLEFLKEVCRSVSVPVYAIGGITEGNIPLVMEQGAAGYCVMSGVMNSFPESFMI